MPDPTLVVAVGAAWRQDTQVPPYAFQVSSLSVCAAHRKPPGGIPPGGLFLLWVQGFDCD